MKFKKMVILKLLIRAERKIRVRANFNDLILTKDVLG